MSRGTLFRTAACIAVSTSLGVVGLSSINAGASTPRVVVVTSTAIPAGDQVIKASSTASFDVTLKNQNAAALAPFIASLSNPESTNYHHYLTPTTFANRFGASTNVQARDRSYLETFGLHVGAISTGHVLFHVSGSTTQMANAFHAALVTLRRPNNSVGVQLKQSATLPSDVASDIAGIYGLGSSVQAQHASTPLVKAKTTLPTTCSQIPGAASAGNTPITFSSGGSSSSGYTVAQQAKLYGLNTQWANGVTGTGQTIGLYELETYAASDISEYQSCYGLSNPITVKNVDGGTSGSSGEATLDIEEAAALAPGASLQVYQGPNNYSGPLDTYTAMADQDTTSVISTSWGTCELDPSGDIAAEASIFQQMAAQGQTIIDAAGDSGSSDCEGVSGITNQAQLAVDDPASQPYVTSVGGLQVSSISPLTESVWNESNQSTNFGFNSSLAEGGGGGESSYWPRPTWQTTTGATSSVTKRMVPDLSVMAQPSTGFITYYDGTWEQAGGTSIGAPIIAALVATAAQYCDVSRLGFINPRLYQMGVAGTGFDDVTVGSNDIENQGSYSAGVGYDMASGWGSPDPSTFIPDLCAALPSSSHTTASLSAKIEKASTPATVSIVAHDALNLPVANQAVLVHVSGAKAKVLGSVSSLTTSATGSVRFAVTSATPGTVTINVVIGSTSVFTGSVSFVRPKSVLSVRT